jgi:hypothetical protein
VRQRQREITNVAPLLLVSHLHHANQLCSRLMILLFWLVIVDKNKPLTLSSQPNPALIARNISFFLTKENHLEN